jgi:hypothetical protein
VCGRRLQPRGNDGQLGGSATLNAPRWPSRANIVQTRRLHRRILGAQRRRCHPFRLYHLRRRDTRGYGAERVQIPAARPNSSNTYNSCGSSTGSKPGPFPDSLGRGRRGIHGSRFAVYSVSRDGEKSIFPYTCKSPMTPHGSHRPPAIKTGSRGVDGIRSA